MGKLKVNGDIEAVNFLGNATSAFLLKPTDNLSTTTYGISGWDPIGSEASKKIIWRQNFHSSELNNDTGDIIYWLANNEYGGTELNISIDGQFYAKGYNPVLHSGNYSSYALSLSGGTMNGVIYSQDIFPKAPMAYILGSASNEYSSTYSRQVFVRHIEPATNINNDVYINYNNRGGTLRVFSSLSMEGIGSIHALPVNGGIYWNPYVESADDPTDACGIQVISAGYLGGTELQIYVQNDSVDCIDLLSPSWILLNGKPAFCINDNWLRINESLGFSAGIYTGSSILRSDNQLQVGSDGSCFVARSDGYGRFSYKLDIGSQISLWQDDEGGNISIQSGNGHTNWWNLDSYNGDLRIYSYRESDGAYIGTVLYQSDGYWANARWATNAGTLAMSGYGNPMTFHWSGQGGQPSWIWGGNDGANMYVYDPHNFNVNSSSHIRATLGNYNAADYFMLIVVIVWTALVVGLIGFNLVILMIGIQGYLSHIGVIQGILDTMLIPELMLVGQLFIAQKM